MADVEQAMKQAIQNGSYRFPQSAAFKGDAKLLACSQSDPAHIGRFTGGGQPVPVGKIQTALAAIFTALGMTPALGRKDNAGTYGDSTASAVIMLKTRIGLRNYAGQFDDVVGIKTIRALDAALVALSGGGGGGGGTEPKVRTLDMYIEIQGTMGANEGNPRMVDELNNFGRLIPISTDPDYQTRHDLHLINFWGSPFPGKSPVAKILAEIASVTAQRNMPPGRTIIIGISNGGPNAIDLAQKLQAIRPVSYLGLLDAAFDGPNDLRLKTFIPARVESYFEALTNSWTDVMPGLEWHGAAPGWGPVSLDFSLGNERTLAETKIALARVAAHARAGTAYSIAAPAFARYHRNAALKGAERARSSFLPILRAP